MKYSLVLIALLGTSSAMKLNQKSAFVDDIVKALAETDKTEGGEIKQSVTNGTANATKGNATLAAGNKTSNATKHTEKEEEAIPMDNAAIKAYSSVIADAAEESEPARPVVYTETDTETRMERRKYAPAI